MEQNKTAIRYARWSTLEQGNSDRSSEERQIIATTEMAKSRGWSFSEPPLIDSGRSAYTGANLKDGELGKFTARVLSGAIDASATVLVVEEMDRLSRRPPGEMTGWLTPLLSAGLTVAIANTGQVITKDVLNNDFGSFVTLMSQAFSAYEFSRKQAARGNGSWAKRRRAYIEEGKGLSRHRGRKWLKWVGAVNSADGSGWEPIEERVEVIREMFRLRLKGVGKASIAKMWNERAAAGDERYAVWVSTTKRMPTKWTVSAVARIVQDPSVTGYIQFCHSPRGADKRIPISDPVKVYPAIIDAETFAKANDVRLVNQLKTQGRGRNVSNLLGPLARCGKCGGIMQPLGAARIRTNKDGSRSQHYFLYCNTAKMTKGAGCDHMRGWTYSKIEQPILDALLTRAMDDQFFRTDDGLCAMLEGKVALLRRKLINQQASAKRIIALAADNEDGDDDLLKAEYADAKARMAATKTELTATIEELAEAQGEATQGEHIVRVSELREQMDSDDFEVRFEVRTKVKLALRGIIDRIVFHPDRGRVVVDLVRGLGILRLGDDREPHFFDLYKRGRAAPICDTEEERAVVQAYVSRLEKAA